MLRRLSTRHEHDHRGSRSRPRVERTLQTRHGCGTDLRLKQQLGPLVRLSESLQQRSHDLVSGPRERRQRLFLLGPRKRSRRLGGMQLQPLQLHDLQQLQKPLLRSCRLHPQPRWHERRILQGHWSTRLPLSLPTGHSQPAPVRDAGLVLSLMRARRKRGGGSGMNVGLRLRCKRQSEQRDVQSNIGINGSGWMNGWMMVFVDRPKMHD
ncbi:hypothetical protein QBC44DRAFT_69962 [Cladorrhinum sp. PSN332]|nr:hypothetical protein QBC44DRAFT_69962 [Cladorrhinum sp. PSN332]